MSNLASGVLRDLVTFIHNKFGIEDFIETGTFMGDSTAFAAEIFHSVFSIEKDEKHFKAAMEKFKDLSHVKVILGDSGDVLKKPFMRFCLRSKTLLWLDAHDVAGQFGSGGDQCPLMQELAALEDGPKRHIILIDDAHCFKPPLPLHLTPEAWPVMSDIQQWADRNFYKLYELGDVIILAYHSDLLDIHAFLTNLDKVQRSLFKPKITCTATVEQTPLKKGVVPTVLPSFTGLVHTEYGWMLVHRLDTAQTPYLSQTGKSINHDDIDKLVQIVRKKGYGSVFVDIGANFGCFSFAMRKFCQEVHAFEPQRIVHNMLAGSIALNGWLNVFSYNVALGDFNGEIEIPQFDYNKALSFGSIEFGDQQKENLAQERMHVEDRIEYTQIRQLDFYEFTRIDVLKIDAEGMEMDVLRGAIHTIDRCRPVMLIEHLKSNKEALAAALSVMSYAVQDVGIDFLCFPIERPNKVEE